jgi:hypothetical protein
MVKYIVEIKHYHADNGWSCGEDGIFDSYSDAITFMNEQNAVFDKVWSREAFSNALSPRLVDI